MEQPDSGEQYVTQELSEFQREIAERKAGEEHGDFSSKHLVKSGEEIYQGGVEPEKLTTEDRAIWEKVKAGSAGQEDLRAYADGFYDEKGERRIEIDESRFNFLAFIRNMMQLQMFGQRIPGLDNDSVERK